MQSTGITEHAATETCRDLTKLFMTLIGLSSLNLPIQSFTLTEAWSTENLKILRLQSKITLMSFNTHLCQIWKRWITGHTVSPSWDNMRMRSTITPKSWKSTIKIFMRSITEAFHMRDWRSMRGRSSTSQKWLAKTPKMLTHTSIEGAAMTRSVSWTLPSKTTR